MTDVRELHPVDCRKSFYGKALEIIAGNITMLKSYDTVVAYIDENRKVHRTWGGWSATTGRHIYAFCGKHKAEWDKLPVEPVPYC